ncbi:MAG: hypothetical protein WCK64_09125 [Synechococcaceae cyanobacterium ELA445]
MVIKRVLAAALLLASGTLPAAAQQPTPLQQCLRRFDANACQLPRSGAFAYDCAYNEKPLACGGLNGSTIRWADGVVTRLRFVREATDSDRKRLRRLGLDDGPRALYTDRNRGSWWQQLFPNGNSTWVNEVTRNQIFVPLRPACQPPLEGDVGYCRPPG